MNRKLLAGVAALGLLAGGGGAAALAVAMPAAATSTAASATATVPAYGPLGSLVAKGTITQAQATAIRDGLIRYMRAHWQDMRRDCTGAGADHTPWMLERGGALDTVLGQLVRSRTLTRAQAAAVTTAYTQWVNSHHGTWQPGYGHRGPMMGGPGYGMMGGSGFGMM
ncbi:MAG: hypothetical protein ACM32E_05895 [Gemmatimonadota bacterium]